MNTVKTFSFYVTLDWVFEFSENCNKINAYNYLINKLNYNDATNGCSKCKKAQYCSKKCQLAHWKNHKTYCGKTICNIQKLKEISKKNKFFL